MTTELVREGQKYSIHNWHAFGKQCLLNFLLSITKIQVCKSWLIVTEIYDISISHFVFCFVEILIIWIIATFIRLRSSLRLVVCLLDRLITRPSKSSKDSWGGRLKVCLKQNIWRKLPTEINSLAQIWYQSLAF